jgi:hypothetical protein
MSCSKRKQRGKARLITAQRGITSYNLGFHRSHRFLNVNVFKPLRSKKGGIKPHREPERINGWIAHAQSSRSKQLAGCPSGYPNVPFYLAFDTLQSLADREESHILSFLY